MNCRLCNSSNTVKLFQACDKHGRHIFNPADHFEILRCRDCQAVFVSNIQVNSGYYSQYYPNNYYDSVLSHGFLNYLVRLMARVSIKAKEKAILKQLRVTKNQKLKILDIGCGNGEFLQYLDNNKFEKYGIEINPQGYHMCENKGIRMFDKDLKDLNVESNFFDVVTLWHVLEHLEKPRELLIAAKKVLKENGILVIATPNTDSLGFKFGRNFWFHLDSPRHLILYNNQCLEYLLKSAGFEVIHEGRLYYDYPLDLFWSLRDSWLKYFIYPFYPVLKTLSKESMLLIFKKAKGER